MTEPNGQNADRTTHRKETPRERITAGAAGGAVVGAAAGLFVPFLGSAVLAVAGALVGSVAGRFLPRQ